MAQALVNNRMDEEVSVDSFYSESNMAHLRRALCL
jgi:hypothetical protein